MIAAGSAIWCETIRLDPRWLHKNHNLASQANVVFLSGSDSVQAMFFPGFSLYLFILLPIFGGLWLWVLNWVFGVGF